MDGDDMENKGNRENWGRDNRGTGNTQSFRAGYEYLLAWKITVPIYDLTVEFCNRCSPFPNSPYSPNPSPNYPNSPYFPYLSSRRTFDQMVQSARSGMTNIPEGNTQDSTEGYLKLTGVNRGSLEELLKDYLSYARQNKIEIWGRDRSVREIREIGIIWEILKKTPTLPDSPNFPNLPNDPTKAVNLMITLINQANYLQTRLKDSVEKKFVENGGFRENLAKKRLEFKRGKR